MNDGGSSVRHDAMLIHPWVPVHRRAAKKRDGRTSVGSASGQLGKRKWQSRVPSERFLPSQWKTCAVG
jgi:hypothetical protein